VRKKLVAVEEEQIKATINKKKTIRFKEKETNF